MLGLEDRQTKKVFPGANVENDAIFRQVLSEKLLLLQVRFGSSNQVDYEWLLFFRSEPVGKYGVPAQLFQDRLARLP